MTLNFLVLSRLDQPSPAEQKGLTRGQREEKRKENFKRKEQENGNKFDKL